MLEVRNLTKIYKSKGAVETVALNSVSLKFPETGMVFLIGKSGSGKSTLLNVAGGLDVPTSGEILIKGRSSTTFKGSDFDSYRNTFVGFVFQEYNILNEFSVEDNIALALQLQGKPKDKKKISKLLEDVDLASYAKRKPNTLSGGQKQRIAIARALIKDPEIIMADEPTGALDSNTGRQVLDTLKKLSKNKLVIVVSHDREFAETYGDRIIELKDGNVISDITKEHSSPKNEGNITIIDNGTFVIKEGTILDEKDLGVINNFLKNSQKEIVISNNESDVKKYKKEARISDDCSKEVFNKTDERKIKSKEYSKEEQKLIRSKLPIHHAIKIGLSSLRLKPFRLITTILLSCVSFIMLGTVSTMMFYNKINVAANALNTKRPKTVTIQKEYETQYKYNNSNSKDYSSMLMLTMFDDNELNTYKAKYGKSIPYFTLEENSIIPGKNVDARSYSILEIKNIGEDNYYYNHFNAFIDDLENPMIKNRLEYGSLPSKYDEITIPSYIADMIINSDNTIGESENSIKSRSDLIGKKINVSGCKYELSIVGVFNCDDLIDKKFEKLKKDYVEENVYSLKSEWANERLTGLFTKGVVNKDFYKINKKYNIEEKSVNVFTEDKSLYIFKFMKFKDGVDYYSLDGTLLDTLPNENIFIGQVDYLKYINNFIDSNQDIIDKNELVGYKNYVDSQNSKDLYYYYNINKYANTIFNKYEGFNKIKFISNDGDEYDFEIKGFSSQDYEVFVDNITYDSLEEIKDNSNSFIEYKTNFKFDSKAKYLGLIIDTSSYNYGDYKKLTSVHEKINTDYSSLSVSSYVMNVIDSEDSFINEWKKVFLWTGIVLAVFSTLLLSNFISLSISNKKKEIGILRAVGAKGSDVFKIFIAESLTIAILCSVLALGGTAFVCYALNSNILKQFGFAILVITLPTVILILMIGILVAIFATLLPVWKIARKKPVDTIRSI